MNLNSKKALIHKTPKTCFDFLSRPENYKSLMPESTEKFELNEQGGFLFKLKGMPEIALKLNEKIPDNKVVWGSDSEKLDFNLTVEIEEVSPEDAEVQLVFEGNFNAMLAMMVKKPLKKFIDTLSDNLRGI